MHWRFVLIGTALALLAVEALGQTPGSLPRCIHPDASKALKELRYDEALAAQREHLKAFDPSSTDLPAQARLICARAYVGVFLSKLERTSEALAILEPLAAESRVTLGPDHAETLNVELMLAIAYGIAARYDAQVQTLQALRPRMAKRYGSKSLELANVLRNLAIAYDSTRNYADALPLDREHLAIVLDWTKQPGNCRDQSECQAMIARARLNLSDSLRRLGRGAEALPLAEQALSELNAAYGPTHPTSLDARLNLASVHSELGARDKALEMDRETLQLAERHLGPDHPVTRKARNNYAVLLYARGDLAESIELDKKQLARLRELRGPDHPETLLSLANLSERLVRAREYDHALLLLEEAMKTMLRTRAMLTFDDRLTLAWQEHWRRLADTYISALLATKRTGDAFLVTEFFKAHLLADRLSLDPAERGLPDESKSALRKARRELGAVEQAAALKRSLGQPTSREEVERSRLLKQISELQQGTSGSGVDLPSAQAVPAWYRTLARDEAQSARVSYFFLSGVVAAFVDQGGRIQAVRLGDAAALRETVEAYRLFTRAKAGAAAAAPVLWARPGGGYVAGPRPGADSNEVTDERVLAKYLSDTLLNPLSGYLKGKTRIIISPDQVLAHVPFDALALDGARLGDQAEITLIPSFALHAHLAQRRDSYRGLRRAPFLGFGGAHYQRVTKLDKNVMFVREKAPTLTPMDAKVIAQLVRKDPSKLPQAFAGVLMGFRDLPGSQDEVRGIADIFTGQGAMYFTGEQAAEATLNRMADDGKLTAFRSLHFAAHGFLSDDEPALSAIVLSQVNRAPGTDGYVTVAEVSSLELKSDLVVISACDSGVGKVQRGEGLLGMSYALFQAGTVASLVTLWPVPDAETTLLMRRFYTEWNAGVSPALALAKAKRWALENRIPPRAVDAFVLFGL